MEPGGSKEVIPLGRFQSLTNAGATGISVDAAGKIWAGCWDSSTAVRMDPQAGPMVVTNGVTNYVGLVDMVVDLGNEPGNQAHPYNYSDMTGFNNRVVNPGLAPLKGYWTVIHDCGIYGEIWKRVVWSHSVPAGCADEVFVRANDDRAALANEAFAAVTNDTPVPGVQGRYLEVRYGMTRTNATQQPTLSDLTLYGSSTSYGGDLFLEEASARETEDALFWTGVTGPEPLAYQWSIQRPWTNQFDLLTGETNWFLLLTNVDLWDDWTLVRLSVSNTAGETLRLGPSPLSVFPLPMDVPGSPTNSSGPAERYPATINVRGQSSNFARVEVTLKELTHYYPADLDVLLVSPSGTKIMLLSDAGGAIGVTNATLTFHPASQGYYSPPPEQGPIPSNQESDYRPWNYGEQETQLPNGAPAGPYNGTLDDLPFSDSNPNGIWSLYIYDDKVGQRGSLESSWMLKFFYQ
jgi:hypothetical protein